MAVETDVPEAFESALAASLAAGISADEGAALLGAAISQGVPLLAVAPAEFEARTSTDVGDQSHTDSSSEPLPILTRAECVAAIAGFWSEALGIDTGVTPETNVFDLGATSLMAISVTERLRNDFRLHVSPTVCYSAPSPKELADIVWPQAAAGKDGNSKEQPGGID